MRKIIDAAQVKMADNDCLMSEKIASHELMDRAASAFAGVFRGLVQDKNTPIIILSGTGNNGGDGLAISRLLDCDGYQNVEVVIIPTGQQPSTDFLYNLERIKEIPVTVRQLDQASLLGFESLNLDIANSVLIDALIGIGVNRPLNGGLKEIVLSLNNRCKRVVAVDIPTGLRGEEGLPGDEVILQADEVIAFQRPKLNFFFPETAKFVGNFYVVDIGLREKFLAELPSRYYCIENSDIQKIYKKRKAFSHKGDYGHVLVFAGSKGKIGAALICAEACLYGGAGLTTVCLPQEDRQSLYARLPEAMMAEAEDLFTGRDYSAIAFGPGLSDRASSLPSLLEKSKAPLVIDADGLNYLASHTALLNILPKETVLTPHMKEFDRLFGSSPNWWERLQLAIRKAQELNLIIVLKNRYTFIVTNTGDVLINPTGNPAMAIGGMGDALTGLIASFLAQGYSPRDACMLGCFLHGRAGDRLQLEGHALVLPTALIKQIPLLLGEIK